MRRIVAILSRQASPLIQRRNFLHHSSTAPRTATIRRIASPSHGFITFRYELPARLVRCFMIGQSLWRHTNRERPHPRKTDDGRNSFLRPRTHRILPILKTIVTTPLFLLFIVFSIFPQTVTKESSQLRVAVDLVLIDVSVEDKNGQPVRNLEKKDFKVYEDKVEQQIISFSTEASPVTWGLVLDRSRSMQAMMQDVYQLAMHVIDQGTNEDDMFIMTFSNKTELVSELTPDRRKLANSIFGLHAEGSTALYDAVDAALDYLKQGKHRKKVLVVITDGGDNRSRIRYSRLIARVKESDVLIYTVGMYANNQIEIRSTGQARDELKQLSEMTGAYAQFPSDSTKGREAMEKIAREVGEHYTIGYYPSNPARDGTWRKNKVVVTSRPNVKYVTRARNGYYAPGKEK